MAWHALRCEGCIPPDVTASGLPRGSQRWGPGPEGEDRLPGDCFPNDGAFFLEVLYSTRSPANAPE